MSWLSLATKELREAKKREEQYEELLSLAPHHL